MTWSVSATLTGNSSAAELGLDFFENYLGNITGWETTSLLDSGTRCSARFDLTGRNDGTADYSYIHLDTVGTATRIFPLCNSTGVADWTTAINSTSSSTYSLSFGTYSGGDVTLWVSDQDAGSFMLTHSTAKILWLFLAPTYLDVSGVAFPANTVDTTVFGPALGGFVRDDWETPFLTGTPTHQIGTPISSSLRAVYSQFRYDGALIEYPSDNETLYQGFWISMQGSTNGNGPVYYVNQSDVLVNKQSVFGAENDLATGITVTDGTNWWIRTSSDLAASSYWLSTGTVEPTL